MMSSSEGGGQDFDLNLAPIIDCFTVLITYLLVSASFISLTVFDIGVAATGEAPPGAPPPEPAYSFSVTIQANDGIELKVTGGPQNINQVIPVPPRAGARDVATLAQRLREIETKYPSVKEVTGTADPTVKYKDVTKVIEVLKKFYPKVFLGG